MEGVAIMPNDGNTALSVAAAENHKEVANFLVARVGDSRNHSR